MKPFLAVSILADGQFNGKGASFAGMTFHFYASVMILNDAVTDREAQSGAFSYRFGAKKRIEYFVYVVRCNSTTGV